VTSAATSPFSSPAPDPTGVDKDAADVVVRAFKKRGIKVQTGVKVNGADRTGDGVAVRYDAGQARPNWRRPRGGERRSLPPVAGHRAGGLRREVDQRGSSPSTA